MDRNYEEHYHRVELRHWWFRARREMVAGLVNQMAPDLESRILDIGCSSGLLLEELRRQGYTDVQGIDSSQDGVALCNRGGLRAGVMDAHKPDFAEGEFEGITASDVLEHLEDDAGALREWWRVLRPGGWLIVFVPAFMWLWTRHDSVNRHFRRYARPQLVRLISNAGFVIERSSYWNTALFLPVASVRLWRRCFGQDAVEDKAGSDMFLPPMILNGILWGWMGLERRFHLSGMNSPVGVSVLVVARKPLD